MVIVTPTKLFELRLDSGIDLSDDPPHHGTVTVVDMPEKGGKGAVASRDLQTGDYIAMTRPVALLPSSMTCGKLVWAGGFADMLLITCHYEPGLKSLLITAKAKRRRSIFQSGRHECFGE
ncbi:hypothetical protein KEM48_002105 [Puccinia striiformis f. sp. tritici PST-130]|nr:hypothetical protein KEM48_002105 [Puccinia striiformis f. sp. tritici PST-130]